MSLARCVELLADLEPLRVRGRVRQAIAACALRKRARSVSFCAPEMNFFASSSLERL